MKWLTFIVDYLWQNFLLMLKLLLRGEFKRVFKALYARVFVRVQYVLFPLRVGAATQGVPPLPEDLRLSVETKNPVAFESPDHLSPYGTALNNSTNRKFVLLLNEHLRKQFGPIHLSYMDMGCSGGQVVADFRTLRWIAVGLEGSDYSLKHRRANWAELANKNLFTCDISKPFRVKRDGRDHQFHLITAWEVVEHLKEADLGQLFDNIRNHLAPGGLFIASTNSLSSVVDGLELHQTRMSNAEWKAWVAKRYSDLEEVDLGMPPHHYVRFDYGEPSYLLYRKKAAAKG